jgi:hypothetical protein
MKVLIEDLSILLKVIYITILKLFYPLKTVYKADLVSIASAPAVD